MSGCQDIRAMVVVVDVDFDAGGVPRVGGEVIPRPVRWGQILAFSLWDVIFA